MSIRNMRMRFSDHLSDCHNIWHTHSHGDSILIYDIDFCDDRRFRGSMLVHRCRRSGTSDYANVLWIAILIYASAPVFGIDHYFEYASKLVFDIDH